MWNGEVMVPARSHIADKTYVVGQHYWLEEVSDRSWISHRQEFAWINEAWQTLPYALAEKFPTPEHLRKAALIATGWHSETILNAESKAAALKVAAYVKGEDEFVHVKITGATVIVRKAKSQRMRGPGRMNKQDFQQSKDAILGWIAGLIGVEPDDLAGGGTGHGNARRGEAWPCAAGQGDVTHGLAMRGTARQG